MCDVTAVQNERQPRNSAQVRQDQLEAEIQHAGSEHGSIGCGVGAGMMGGATVSATHPAFTPVRPAHDGSTATDQHRSGTVPSSDVERRTGRKPDSEHHCRDQITGMLQWTVVKLSGKRDAESIRPGECHEPWWKMNSVNFNVPGCQVVAKISQMSYMFWGKNQSKPLFHYIFVMWKGHYPSIQRWYTATALSIESVPWLLS